MIGPITPKINIIRPTDTDFKYTKTNKSIVFKTLDKLE